MNDRIIADGCSKAHLLQVICLRVTRDEDVPSGGSTTRYIDQYWSTDGTLLAVCDLEWDNRKSRYLKSEGA